MYGRLALCMDILHHVLAVITAPHHSQQVTGVVVPADGGRGTGVLDVGGNLIIRHVTVDVEGPLVVEEKEMK